MTIPVSLSALLIWSAIIACVVLLITLGWKLVKRFLKIWLVVIVVLLLLKFLLGIHLV